METVHFTPDGKEIIIRTAGEGDALNLLELKKSYIRGTRSIPMYEYEYSNDIHQEKNLIIRYEQEENSLLLVAEHAGRLIGNIDLTGRQRKKLYHTGMIGMGIAYEWQNRKIGSLLMEGILEWAKASPLTIIWLEVYSTNVAGIALYNKFGFEACGLIRNFFEGEQPADKITMVKYL